MLFLQVLPSAFIWKILKVQCPYQKLLQWLFLSRAGLLKHETRVTASSSLPRAANQELGISWSECQTSLAPSKSTWTIPHSSSNEVLCWTPRLFEYCTQVCSHWALWRSPLELWPRVVVPKRWVIDCSLGSCECRTQWDEKEPSTLTHLCLEHNPPSTKSVEKFPLLTEALWRRPWNCEILSPCTGLQSTSCREVLTLRGLQVLMLHEHKLADRSNAAGASARRSTQYQLLLLFWEQVFMAHRISAMKDSRKGSRCWTLRAWVQKQWQSAPWTNIFSN